jgi:UDP-N-acetylmuramoyl-L-alanyl-D-glutamate--2,6-diaminopimelate ligase
VTDATTLRPAPTQVSLGAVCDRLRVAHTLDDLMVTGVTLDSRSARPGDVFVALSGERAHGATFADQAVRSGAVAVVTDSEGAGLLADHLPVVVMDDPRARVGELAAEVYGRPADGLLMLGVTGTNGKTTTTFLLEAGLRAAGHRPGVVGTVATFIDGEAFDSSRTTPEAPELHALFAVMRERGVTAVAMEVSSHALAMGRVDGFTFDVAGFTQLGVDHLDFHGSEEAYFAAKQLLFSPARAKRAVITVDDDGGARMAARSTTRTTTLGESPSADLTISDVVELPAGGYRFSLGGAAPRRQLATALLGRFNVGNAALAQSMLELAGVDASAASDGIASCRGVPGRMERVGPSEAVLVVDYAHTADALARAIDAVRPHDGGEVIVVFGCGGDRDPFKRAPMGRVAAEYADVAVVTDDNPRSEAADRIRQAVLAGAEAVPVGRRAELVEIAGRAEAIEWAVRRARPGSVVLVAGKGHETGQEARGVVSPFDDREELAAAWERVHGGSP